MSKALVELYGGEGSGKTTVGLCIVTAAQRQGGRAALIDAEHALDPAYARRCGVNLEELWISQADSAEDVLTLAEMLIRSSHFAVIVIDGVAALIPAAELDAALNDDSVAGAQARVLSRSLRGLNTALSNSNTVLLFTNQVRDGPGGHSTPLTTPGGRALKHFASVRLELHTLHLLETSHRTVIGQRTRICVTKNKVAAPYAEAEFDLLHTEGISRAGALIDVGLAHKLLDRDGTAVSWHGQPLGADRAAAIVHLNQHLDVANLLEQHLRELLLPGHAPNATPVSAG